MAEHKKQDGQTDGWTERRMDKVITVWPQQSSSGWALIIAIQLEIKFMLKELRTHFRNIKINRLPENGVINNTIYINNTLND